ncbi:PucR family transcriptional regulator [Amycolatopsis taiwanensis]|uniref:PucR C-terminal helix-turn-helix domain-containing protein n=1 Tax=Amycolatopsis taiwanensis TaxID=342230 RepID=A0A9W6R0D6_9PSEU|nr:helix-turn-helix domain-containing protein [Amycolatopsis taiwanensis]GLY65327.1 hypothetical protein Atai01_19460 [Amycolatopsis taiwanensis]
MTDTADLFGLAQDLAGLLGCPVTIEDPDTIVVAYAGDHHGADTVRVETILNRQVPARYRQAIDRAGVFDRLRQTDEVIVVDLPEMSMTPRAVVALRSGRELLGSIWAALDAPPTPQQAAVLETAAPVIARHVRLARRAADQAASERDALLARLLAGGEVAVRAAGEAGLGERLVVVALRGHSPLDAEKLDGPLTLHLRAVAPQSICALRQDTLYCVMASGSAQRIIGDFLTRVSGGRDVVAGIGEAVGAGDLPRSAALAAEVAGALVRRRSPSVVAGLPEVFTDLLVDRLRGFLMAHADASPLTVLEKHDEEHETGLVPAVDAFLTESENVLRAAQALHVHPNTIRNRIRRAREVCGVDPEDPATKLALMVHLAVRRSPGPL